LKTILISFARRTVSCTIAAMKIVSERYGIIPKLSIFFFFEKFAYFVRSFRSERTGPPGGGPAHVEQRGWGQAAAAGGSAVRT
jgi:hypothetical protein